MRNYCTIMLVAVVIFINGCKKDNEKNDAGEVATLSDPTDGEIVLSTYVSDYSKPSKLLVLDKKGKVLSEKSIPVAAINLQKWQVGGKVRYTYLEYDSTAFKITNTGSIVPCTGVVMDENFQQIKRVRLLPNNGRTSSDPNALDGHEFIYLGDNHFITLSYFQKPVTNIPASLNAVANCKVVAPIIQEIMNDNVVWEWDGTNYPEFYQQSIEGNAFSNASVVHDYIHMNSITVDPTDNNLICSMRNLNQIIKISRTDGRIIWRLGGTNSNFPMTADMKFLRQHHATLTDNNQTLLLVDNGEAVERPYTRILEFKFGNSQSSIASFKSFTLPQGIFVQYTGSVQKRGETYFVGCGGTNKILEVNYNTNKVNFLMDLTSPCYRALKN